jgi:hypothetical protein
MTLITMPSGGIKAIDWTQPEWAGFVVRSGWTAKQTVGDLGNVRAGWKCKVALTDRTVAKLLPWRTFMALAKGPTNVFVVGATDFPQPAPYNDLVVQGSGQTGSSIALRTAHASTFFLAAGSLIHVATTYTAWQMFTLTADLVSNGSGIATASLDRPIRYAWPDGTGVEIINVGAVMRLVTPTFGWGARAGKIYMPTGFDCEEAV